jgi:hypothetical protein
VFETGRLNDLLRFGKKRYGRRVFVYYVYVA